MSMPKINYECNLCHAEVVTKKQFIEHYREVHPEHANDLFSAIGTIGDKFADTYINMLRDEARLVEKYRHALNEAESANKGLVEMLHAMNFKNNQLLRSINTISDITVSAKEIASIEVRTETKQ
jgi:uncharacterized protein YpiB (UPF0302 family)